MRRVRSRSSRRSSPCGRKTSGSWFDGSARRLGYRDRNWRGWLSSASPRWETIEQGHGNPGLTRMMNLAHALKHTLSYLFGLTQELNDEEKH